MIALAALALLAILLGAGCGGEAPLPLALVPASEAMDGARIEGRLVLENNCLYLVSDTTGSRTLPVLPRPGTKWDQDEEVLTVRGIPFRVGLPVSLGGSGRRAEEGWRQRIDWAVPPPKSCDPDELWFSTAGGDYSAGIAQAPAPWYLALTPPGLTDSVTGRLGMDEGCIYLVEDNGTRWQPVFPDGTFIDTATYTIFGLPLDQRTELTGGAVEVADHGVVGLDAWVSPLNESCDTSHLWLVVSGRTLGPLTR